MEAEAESYPPEASLAQAAGHPDKKADLAARGKAGENPGRRAADGQEQEHQRGGGKSEDRKMVQVARSEGSLLAVVEVIPLEVQLGKVHKTYFAVHYG